VLQDEAPPIPDLEVQPLPWQRVSLGITALEVRERERQSRPAATLDLGHCIAICRP
jgi:hypothetical protein